MRRDDKKRDAAARSLISRIAQLPKQVASGMPIGSGKYYGCVQRILSTCGYFLGVLEAAGWAFATGKRDPVMSLLGGHRPNHLSSQRLFLSGSVFIAITIIAAWIAIWDLHGERIADETKDTKNLAVVLAEQTARAIQAVDLVVQETQAMVLAAGVTDADQFRRRMGTEGVHHFLLDRLHSLPQANSIALLDDAGRIVNFSRAWPVPVIDASDRDFYAYFREHNDPTPFIGVPVVNKFSGAWVIMLTRRISGPRGEFVGIVAGVVEARYFEDFYRAIRTNGGEAASLFRRDGTLLARHPHLEGMIGTNRRGTHLSPMTAALIAHQVI
jgi:hypothetical protein